MDSPPPDRRTRTFREQNRLDYRALVVRYDIRTCLMGHAHARYSLREAIEFAMTALEWQTPTDAEYIAWMGILAEELKGWPVDP